MGLLGFEQHKQFTLVGSPEEAPFLWLHIVNDANLSFLVISPFMVLPSYQLDLSEEDTKFLGLEKSEDALIFNIVTVHGDGQATVNLKGPIVVNRQTLTGKQCIPRNSAIYSLPAHHRIRQLIPTMLVLARKLQQKIVIGDDIVIHVLRKSRDVVKLGIDADVGASSPARKSMMKFSAATTPRCVARGTACPRCRSVNYVYFQSPSPPWRRNRLGLSNQKLNP